MYKALFILCFLISWLSPMVTSAQEVHDSLAIDTTKIKRPKIGLALSGGAAHGLAHLGVIKYLEELGIEVDYITGTSMGSIVGGLMAMGYDAQQMIHIAATQNWNLILSNRIPLEEVASCEKFLHDKFLLSLNYKKGSIGLPKGFFAGQKLDLLISKLFLPAFHINDFNKLPIPFHCFAVDITNGEIVTLQDGFLGRAVRSSMAIPSVFAPVESGERLLVDGGLIRNFPVSNNLDMGADIVIGSYVGSKLEEKESLVSLFDIMKQSAAMLSITDSEEQKELCEVLIEPDIKEMNVFGFDKYRDFVQLGYDAAKKSKEELKETAKMLESFPKNGPREVLKLPDSILISDKKLEGSFDPFDQVIRDKLSVIDGSYLSISEFEDNIAKVYGTKNFGNISYSLSGTPSNADLVVYAPPKEEVQFSINVNHFKFYNTAFVLNTVFRNVFTRPSRLDITARISDNPAFLLNYFHRLGAQKNFLIGLSTKTNRNDQGLYDGDILLNQFKSTQLNGAVNFIWEPDNKSMAVLSGGIEQNQLKNNIFLESILRKYFTTSNFVKFNYRFNNEDERYFQKKGQSIEIQAGYHFNRRDKLSYFNMPEDPYPINTEGNYLNFQFNFRTTKNLFDRIYSISQAHTFYTTEDNLLSFTNVGGTDHNQLNVIPFIGLSDHQINLNKALVMSQSFRYEFIDHFFFSAKVNYVIGESYFSQVFTKSEQTIEKNILGFGLSLSIDSPIGPVTFEIGRNTLDNTQLSYGLGHSFVF